MCHGDKVGSVVIDAMINAVGEQDDIAVVRRGVDPIVEWDENGYMIAGAFPTLFMMGGDMLPSGSFSLEREAGAFGTVAGFNGVVEPQVDGQLHLHMTVYGSSFTPEILTRGDSSEELLLYIAEWLNSVCTNHLTTDTREWLTECGNRGGSLPRACEVTLPPAGDNLAAFYHAVEKSIVTTNIHSHSRTCIKGKRGQSQCRLCRPAGIHNQNTQPLHVSKSNGAYTGQPLSPEQEAKLDAGYDTAKGEFLRPHIAGPVVWEQFRTPPNGMFIETNMLLSGLTGSHCNSSVMNGEDAGDMVDQYQQNYMTKEAPDSGAPMRQGQYLATRTVNAFGGAHEWPLSLMVYALLGDKSYVSSESFWYIFPHGFIDELRKSEHGTVAGHTSDTRGSNSSTDSGDDSTIDGNFDVDAFMDSGEGVDATTPITEALEELATIAQSENLSDISLGLNERHTTGGARGYKVDG
ncbi:hypothetical protein PPTG_24588 [Phytophthora nicotianae INRA-310]|uniref:Helitron helicase-like domain-containing protein n=1 Tax=Phytophthora nicotianae (strain INRA-310) TaxID=761204 RepID=W2PD28_PHYN3|nr:hypothetical protein PPTG_24588 [Phytophthora nicotianae INRA-310]ETM98560.1 hypothetical protein PPTG_24588 [Phytophthora nicotianae INRA-310]